MPSPTLVEVTCPGCKINLRVNHISIETTPTNDPNNEGVIRCPACNSPIFKIAFGREAP